MAENFSNTSSFFGNTEPRKRDYFPLFPLFSVSARLKIIFTFLALKAIMLVWICDIGTSDYACVEEILRVALENDGKLALDTGINGLCAPAPFYMYGHFAITLMIFYILWDLAGYICLFICEEKVASTQIGSDKMMNFWRENELYAFKNHPK